MKQLCVWNVSYYGVQVVRNEALNIGVILYDEKGNRCESAFSNMLKLGDISSTTRQIINEYKDYFNTAIFKSKDEFMIEIGESKGSIQFTDVHGVVTDDFDKELVYLFDVFVGE